MLPNSFSHTLLHGKWARVRFLSTTTTTTYNNNIQQQHKLYYQIKVKLNSQCNILIQKKVTFTQNN